MASGKAAIGSGVGGIPEVVKDWKNGLLFPHATSRPSPTRYTLSAWTIS
jgi:glycosyltransferase involved in cell wall biosynthesis